MQRVLCEIVRNRLAMAGKDPSSVKPEQFRVRLERKRRDPDADKKSQEQRIAASKAHWLGVLGLNPDGTPVGQVKVQESPGPIGRTP